jgi:hypothetical protein
MSSWLADNSQRLDNGESSSSGARPNRANSPNYENDINIEDSVQAHGGASNQSRTSNTSGLGNLDIQMNDPPARSPPNHGLFPPAPSHQSVSGASLDTTDIDNALADLSSPSSKQNADPEKTEEEIIEMRLTYEAELAAREVSRQKITINALEDFGINFGAHDPLSDSEDEQSADDISDQEDDLWGRSQPTPKLTNPRIPNPNFGFFEALGHYPEVSLAIAKHLHINSFLHLYAMSRDFHIAVDQNLTSCVLDNAKNMAPESAKIFPFTLYAKLLVADPSGRPHPQNPNIIRQVPGLRYLQMIHHRDKTVRDILACLARQGHRTPKDMPNSLKKMWLLMDLSTTRQRVMFMHSRKFFTDMDLYNIQFFIVKLDMRFNDPIDGPADDDMRKLMLGQRGLTPLRNLLRRKAFLTYEEIITCQVRYQYNLRPQDRGWPIWGVKPADIGAGHLEGWGQGKLHLMRPDELVVREAVRRGIDLKNHVMLMLLWGYVDPKTGEDILPTEEEMYMSDEEPASFKYKWKEDEVDADSSDEREESDLLSDAQPMSPERRHKLMAERALRRKTQQEGKGKLKERAQDDHFKSGFHGLTAQDNKENILPGTDVRTRGQKRSFEEDDIDLGGMESNSDEDYADSDNDIHNISDSEFDIPDSPIKREVEERNQTLKNASHRQSNYLGSSKDDDSDGQEAHLHSQSTNRRNFHIDSEMMDTPETSIQESSITQQNYRAAPSTPRLVQNHFRGLGLRRENPANTLFRGASQNSTTNGSSATLMGPSNLPPAPRISQSTFGGFGSGFQRPPDRGLERLGSDSDDE